MTVTATTRGGGRILVDALLANGADLAFCVAGESYLEVLDAATDRPDLRLITCRQEGGAAFMAEAYGKLTGRPGICMVTRGPGACNAAIGVHTAAQDSSPMIMLVGQVARHQLDREAFQEIDFRQMFGPVAKWVAQIDRADRIPEYIARAFQTATSGRPGPVVLALPEDMLRETATVPDIVATKAEAYLPEPAGINRLAAMVAASSRPLAIIGGAVWDDEACGDLLRFLEAWRIPAACSFRRQDLVDNDSPAFIGDLGTGVAPSLVERVRNADLILAIGTRLGEIPTQGYSLLVPPKLSVPLIHIHADMAELGRVYQPDLAIPASLPAAARALAALVPPSTCAWADWAEACRADYLAWQCPSPYDGALDLGAIFTWLRDRLPDDAIITNDAGNFSGWGHRFLRYGRPGRQLAPVNGAMGYAFPAALAAKLTFPDRLCLSMSGDGGFLMTGQELASAIHAGAAPVALIFNNGMYGTIRMHQEQRFPERVSATSLTNPDFAALAQAYGAFGVVVERTADFAPAFEAALASGKPAVIELRMDPEVITTRTSLSAMRAAALARQAKQRNEEGE
ncbi:thiamine pyrophosphate-binding protein [Niveispirillum irakense]|uniref:thiamine pyrophosphate-binding protein n=1 Tax=Niveispirillum irakense TaxID=34011 RepID=UPI0003F6F74A|nr:thiamine pyrophosphate-binding protein [Niveispirillum irakense]